MTPFRLPSTAVVTGAGGFIGRHLSRYLSEHGCNVRGIGHSAMSDEDRDRLGISLWYSGGISSSALKKTCQGAEIIYHCAGSGSVPLSLREPMTDFSRNVLATVEVLEYSRQEGGIPIVFLSTAGVYGKVDRMPIHIDDPFRPISPYGMNKVTGEQLMHQYGIFFGVPGVIVRLFSVYGEGLRKQLLWDASHKLRRDDRIFFGTGEETRDWIHVSDAVSLIARVGTYASVDVPAFHGATGEAVRIRDVLELLASKYGIEGKIAFNDQIRAGDPMYYQADIASVLGLGWAPKVPLEDGLSRYADWFGREVEPEVTCHAMLGNLS